ncbi:TRAM domain-containing protein [Candidatus Saccharibacteria bacterium]|nr:TRAM domain-containing protein [Candidatus Saccharibacteria bacterium]
MEILLALLLLCSILILVRVCTVAPIVITRRRVLVDTSILMDGRVLGVARTGLIGDYLLVLESTLKEMQMLADGNDTEKRTRARAGMETLKQLSDIDGMMVKIIPMPRNVKKVDDALLVVAKRRKALIMTNDFNLGQVAHAEGIKTINMNDLGQNLRVEHLPGEMVAINLTQKGSGPRQAVGYLDDGTMVVVDEAESMIGERAEVEVTRFFQTQAGRMMFARLKGRQNGRGGGREGRRNDGRGGRRN